MGNCFFTIPGRITFPKAMPAPAMIVPAKRGKVPGIARSSVPAVNMPSAIAMVPSVPRRRVNSGVNTDRSPNERMGRVVSIPKSVFERPVSARISEIRGPTAEIGGRRLNAIAAMAIIRNSFRFRSGDIRSNFFDD